MANEKIVLASLDLDIKGLTKAAADSKTAIETLKKELEKLKDAGKEASKEFKNLQKQLEDLIIIYAIQIEAVKKVKTESKELKAVQEDLNKETKKAVKANEDLSESLEETAKNAKDAYEEIESLNDELEDLADNADQTKTEIDDLNDSLETNNELMEQGGHKMSKSTGAFNQYKTKVKESFNEINIFNGGLQGFGERAEKAGGFKNLFVKAFDGISAGIKGMGAALTANPVGVILQILGQILIPIIEQIKKFAPLTNALQQAMAGLSPVLELVKIPIEAIAKLITFVVQGFTALIGSISSTADEAIKLKQAEQELATQMALQESANQKAKQQIDELLERSRDHSLSERERAKAIQEATQIQLQNYKQRADIANKTYDIEKEKLIQSKNLSGEEIKILEDGDAAKVQALLNTKDITTEELEAFENAKIKKIEIANEENEIREQQTANFKALTDELIDKANDQSLSEEERLKAVKEAAELEKEFYNDRKKEINDEARDLLNKSDVSKKISKEEIEKFIEQGEAYENKTKLIKLLSDDELKHLKAIADEKRKLNYDEVEDLKKTTEAEQNIYDQKAAQAERDRKEREKKQLDANKEYAQTLKLQLDLYIQAESQKKRSAEEEIAYLKEIERQKIAIANAEFAATKKTKNDKLALELKLNEISNNSAKEQMEFAIANANKELEIYLENHKSKITAETELTAAIIEEENKRLQDINAKKLATLAIELKTNDDIIAAKQAANQQLSEEDQKYLAKRQALDAEYKTTVENNNKALEDQEKAKKEEELNQKIADIENRRAQEQLTFEEDLALQAEKDEVLKAYEIEQAEGNQAAIDEINQKYDNKEKERDKALTDFRLGQAKKAFGEITQLLGENSAAGKAAALANATINTYEGVTQVWAAPSALLEPAATISKVANTAVVLSSGLAAAKKIAGTKTPKAEKGALFNIGGQRHSAGGTLFRGEDGTQFEAEQGELIGVMNRNAARHFMAFNNAFPAGGASAPNYFENGGIVSRDIATPGLNTDELAYKIAEANRNIPAPVVSVKDIITEGDSYVQVRQGANF